MSTPLSTDTLQEIREIRDSEEHWIEYYYYGKDTKGDKVRELEEKTRKRQGTISR
jgi:hypothetical protein